MNPYLLLVLILGVGAALRLNRSGFDCLTFDEQWHVELSIGRGSVHVDLPDDALIAQAPALTSLDGARPWYTIWTNVTGAVHPPLYLIVLRLWREAFGEGDSAARGLSIFCSLGAIALTFEAGRRLIGAGPALAAAALSAVAPNQVYMAQQVRGYAMLQMLGAATLLAAARLEQSNKPDLRGSAAVGVCVLLMMLTHYFAFSAALGIGVWALIRLRGRLRIQVVAALVGAGVVYLIIWLPWVLPQLPDATGAHRWLHDERPHARLSTLARLASSAGRLVVSSGTRFTERVANDSWAYFSMLLFILPPLLMRRQPKMMLWYLWMVGSLGFLAVLDLARTSTHLRFTRYLILAAPGAFLLFTTLMTLAPAWLGRALVAAALVGSLAASGRIYVPEEPDWQALGRFLDEHARPGEAVVVYHGLSGRLFRWWYYLAAAHYSNHFPAPLMKLTAPASAELMRQLPGDTVWLITSNPGPDAAEILPGSTVLEKYDVPTLASCIRVRLPDRAPASLPLNTGSPGP